jgi:site-specific recombinase XerD
MIVPRRIQLPAFARTYITAAKRHVNKRIVVMLHKWLLASGKTLRDLKGVDVEVFVACPSGKKVGQMTRNDYRYGVRLYLEWLEEKGLAGPFGPQELDGYHRRELPDEVRRYLQFLAPKRRPSTVKNYRQTLGTFHEWLDARKIVLADVGRDVCLEWGQHLHAQGIGPAARVGQLVCVRKYIDWLWEHGTTEQPGHELILASDLPKKPDYLPRPLPPDADRLLQDRLQKEESAVALGLLLMRRTGLRIGELSRLERDCVRKDHVGGRFLKVPLGKLYNERLVPLDSTAIATLAQLRRLGSADSPWLIEGARDRPVSAQTYRQMLMKVGGDMPLSEPLTPHRLRHSFATSLMNGGMSLLGIMKLLGHRDQRMSLRYTAIADETVGREYFEALTRVAERYDLRNAEVAGHVEADPTGIIEAAISWVVKHLCHGPVGARARLLVRRLEAAREELEELRAADSAER